MSKKRFLAGFMGLLLLITSVFTGNVMTAKAVTNSTIRFNDQTSEGETSKAYQYGRVSYKIGDGRWTEVTSADEISISTIDTVYFRLIANENYQVDMTRNVNLYSTKDSGSQTLTVNTDDESGTVTGIPNAQYFMFTPEANEETQTLYGYEICFGFEAVSQSGGETGGGTQYGDGGALRFNVSNNGNGGTVTFAVTSSSIGAASGTTYTVGGDSNNDDPAMQRALSNLQFASGDTITISATPNTEANYEISQFSVLVNGASRDVSTAIVDGKVTSFVVTITEDEATKPVEVNVDFQGQNSGGSDNNGKIRFLCRSNPVTGGHVRVSFDGSSYVGVLENEDNSYGTIDLPQDASNSTVVYFKFEANSGYSLDTGRGVAIWVDGVSTALTENAEGAYTYTLPESPLEKQYELEFGWESGNGGGEQQNVSFSCTSMNGNENDRVDAVEVSRDGGSTWVDYYNTDVLDQLTEGTTFKVRIKMNDGYTIDKVSLDYESFDHNSRVGYPDKNYDAIINALLSEDGYEITFQPEADSLNSDEQRTLIASETCLCLQYQTAISYAEQVNINMFFQIKDEELGYGVGRNIDDNDYFVDGVGSDEIKFSFNGNNYGENGDPFELGYGKNNNGEPPISVSYLSKHESNNGKKVSDTPKSYDYFSAGGYTSGATPNTIRFDDYDGLIDEIYIDTDGDEHFDFEDCVTLTKLRGTDWEGKEYSYYEMDLDAAESYNILIRKHRSTRVSLKWSYTDEGTDFYVDHGEIFIEKVVRGSETLYEAETDGKGDLVLNEQGVPTARIDSLGNDYNVSSTAGEVFLECGDVVTIRLIPTYGYQIKDATLNRCVPLTANEKVSSFTFTVEGNLHLAGNFDTGTDVTDTTGTEKINDAGIADGQHATNSGNLKLTVEDYSGTYAKESEALNLAKGENANATTIATLDMTLESMVSKGDGQYWTDNITSFTNDIKVNLDLNDTTYKPGDTYVVVREHTNDLGQTELEKLTTTYSNGMLEVPTNKFSTYSIVKIPVSEENRPNMHLIYDDRGYDENAPGSVTVKDSTSTELVGTDGYFKYAAPDQELTFELVKPGDRSDCTPVVEVVFPQENAEPKVFYPPVTDNNTFTITPSTASGLEGSPYMEVLVWWSEYDQLEPDENQFMFIMNQPLGGGTFVFQNDLTPKASKSLGSETKYVFENGTEVSVELKPEENKELVEVFLFQDDQGIHYSGDPDSFQEDLEEQRNIEELKVGDKYILSGLRPWAYVDVFFMDIPVLSDITQTTGILYDSMKGSDVTVSSTCKIGEEVISGTTKLKDQDSYLLEGTNDYVVEFTSDPDETGERFTVEGTISLTVLHNDVSSIDITTQPTKTSYTYGESFDKTGLVVTAHYLDGTTQNVTDYVTFEGEIVPSNTTIVVKYTRDNVTVSNNITISVSHAMIDISALGWTGETFEYNGTAQGPTFSSTLPAGVALTSTENDSKTAQGNYKAVAYIRLDSDYPTAYYKLQDSSNSEGINVAVGGATATVSKNWSITAKSLANAQITLGDALTYNGTAQTQTIASVTVDGRTLTEYTDYTITENTGTAAGTYTLTITGQGNYIGTATKEWTIGKQSISNATVTLGAALTYNGTIQTQTVSSVAIGESTLTATTDYTISGNQKKDAGTYTLTVTGNGNYDGTITKDFTINTVTVTPTLTGTVTKTYDNTTTVPESNNLTLTVTGTISPDTLTVNAASYAYDDATVGNGKTITASGITISGDAAKNYTLSGTTATVAGGEITQATPTITLSGLSETTQAPTGVKATLNPADANAQVVIEYQVVDTPAVAATPEVPCNVTHDEGCTSLAEDKTIADCNCTKAHTSHNSECGYKAATSGSPATYKWVTTRPTTPGTYNVRAYLPTGTTNVAAIAEANAVTGTYTLTKYTAPSGGDPNSGSGSGSNSGSGSTSSGGTTNTAPTTPAETESTTPATAENTTTATTIRRPAATTEENNEETASETKIGVASEDGAEGWTDIKTEISDKLTGVLEAEEGEELVVAVEMNGEDTVPADVFEAIEGQDITVTFDMGNGIVWAVNGMDVTADAFKDINFAAATGDGVTAIPVALKTSLVDNRFSMELTLEFEGEFGLTAVMSVDVKKENAGKYANLFYFNPQSETMEYICSAQIKEDGTADLTFTHASDYVIVVDEVIMSVADNTSMEQVQEAAPQETPVEMSSVEKDTAENDSFNLFWIIAVGILILVVGTIAILAVKKKKE